LDILIALG
jgi:hypothetical protein